VFESVNVNYILVGPWNVIRKADNNVFEYPVLLYICYEI